MTAFVLRCDRGKTETPSTFELKKGLASMAYTYYETIWMNHWWDRFTSGEGRFSMHQWKVRKTKANFWKQNNDICDFASLWFVEHILIKLPYSRETMPSIQRFVLFELNWNSFMVFSKLAARYS